MIASKILPKYVNVFSWLYTSIKKLFASTTFPGSAFPRIYSSNNWAGDQLRYSLVEMMASKILRKYVNVFSWLYTSIKKLFASTTFPGSAFPRIYSSNNWACDQCMILWA